MQLSKTDDTNTLGFSFFLMEGMGSLISWNAVLNGIDYFVHRFPKHDVEFIFPIAFTISQLISCFFILKLSQLFSLTLRIMTSLLILMFVLVVLPFEATYLENSDFGFWLVISLLFLIGFFGTVLSASLTGLVSLFPAKYASYMMMGTAISGLIMNVLRAWFLLVLKHTQNGEFIGIILYFAVSSLLVIACMIIHPIFMRSSFCRAHILPSEEVSGFIGDQQTELIKKDNRESTHRTLSSMIKTLREVWEYILLNMFTQIQTFIMFPAVMLKKPMAGMGLDWKLVSMIGVFNVGCLIGQKASQFRKMYNKSVMVMTLIARTLLVVFFIIQVTRPDLPVFNTDWFGYLNILLFALTYGFLATGVFILSTEAVLPDKKENVGFIAVFAGSFGVAMGAALSYCFKDMGEIDE